MTQNPSVFNTLDFQICFSPQRRAVFRHRLAIGSSKSGPNPRRFDLPSTSQLPKVIREWFVLYILTSACASRHNGVHFFHIATSKSAPRLTCFDTFLLPRTTTARTFSTSQPPKVVWDPGVLTLFTSKCASRHNGVQCFISHLPRCLHTRRFREPTFRPSGATEHWKNTHRFMTSLPFRAAASSLFWISPSLIFSLLTFSTSEFLPGSASSWLCFFIYPYCRKFHF